MLQQLMKMKQVVQQDRLSMIQEALCNWLGQKIDGFKVKMECYWNEDGMDSSIDNLVGTWTRYDNRFTLRWDDDAYVAQTYHSLGLNITHTSGNAYYIFSALINILLDPPECDIDYGAY